jgi:uncharacterized membrane protein YhhN
MIHLTAKPAIMASLLVYVLAFTRGIGTWLKWMLMLAIVLSMCGDIALMMVETDQTFMLGLGAFLLAHAMYCVLFTKQSIELIEISFIRRHPWFMFLSGLFAFWMWKQLQPVARDILLPLTIYMATITLMLILAFNRQLKVGYKSFLWVAIGALLFVASDSLLAWNKFIDDLPHSQALVLASYGLAQLLIVSGMVEQLREEKTT